MNRNAELVPGLHIESPGFTELSVAAALLPQSPETGFYAEAAGEAIAGASTATK